MNFCQPASHDLAFEPPRGINNLIKPRSGSTILLPTYMIRMCLKVLRGVIEHMKIEPRTPNHPGTVITEDTTENLMLSIHIHIARFDAGELQTTHSTGVPLLAELRFDLYETNTVPI